MASNSLEYPKLIKLYGSTHILDHSTVKYWRADSAEHEQQIRLNHARQVQQTKEELNHIFRASQ